jgi:hypothetical protein
MRLLAILTIERDADLRYKGVLPSSPYYVSNPKARVSNSRVRKLARLYLSQLPKHFVPGFAYMREDGTVAADPDAFIRSQLRREGDSVRNAGGDSGGSDD